MATAPVIGVAETYPDSTGDVQAGQSVRVRVTWFDCQTLALTDPDTVTLTIHPPNTAKSTPAAVKDSVGVYHYDLPVPAQSGLYRIWWQAITSVGSVVVGSVYQKINYLAQPI